MKKIISATLVAILLLVSCKKQELITPLDITDNPLVSTIDLSVQSAYLKYKNGLNTVGISIAILKDGNIYYYGYGEIKKGTGIIPGKNTFFEIGSLTKTYTAIAVAEMLLKQGRTIETPIRSYLPSDLPTLQRNGIEVTFKHLLTHTAGIPFTPDNIALGIYNGNVSSAYANYDRNKLFTFIRNLRLKSDPFTSFTYSNSGFGILGVILEDYYKARYGDLIKNQVLIPLNLNDTRADLNETDGSRWATGYANGKEAAYWPELNTINGAGVLKSTTADVMKYAQANLDPPATPLGDAIRATHVLTYPTYYSRDYYKIRGCLSWFEYTNDAIPDTKFLFHNGGTGGFNSTLFINPEKKSALVVLFNTDGGTADREEFFRELLMIIK